MRPNYSGAELLIMFDFNFVFDKVSAQVIHFNTPNSFSCTYLRKVVKIFNPVEFVRVMRFAEFKKKFGASHLLASLIEQAIDKFGFKR